MNRRRVVLLSGLGLGVLAACNAITGAHDRVLEDPAGDGGSNEKDHDGSGDADAVVPQEAGSFDAGADVDANSVHTIHLTGVDPWTTPNKANFTAKATGVTILDAATGAAHAVVIPMPLPNIPVSNYTVLIGVDVRKDCEFGILTRVRDNGSGVILGARVSDGQQPQPFLARMGPPSWEPQAITKTEGTKYNFNLPGHYLMKLVAQDSIVTGKMWLEGTAEPAIETLFQDVFDAGDRGHGIGFYEFFYGGDNDVTFTDATITYVAP